MRRRKYLCLRHLRRSFQAKVEERALHCLASGKVGQVPIRPCRQLVTPGRESLKERTRWICSALRKRTDPYTRESHLYNRYKLQMQYQRSNAVPGHVTIQQARPPTAQSHSHQPGLVCPLEPLEGRA